MLFVDFKHPDMGPEDDFLDPKLWDIKEMEGQAVYQLKDAAMSGLWISYVSFNIQFYNDNFVSLPFSTVNLDSKAQNLENEDEILKKTSVLFLKMKAIEV